MTTRDDVAIVTGAGRGIGRAVCEELARRGVRVIGISRTGSELDEVARSVAADGRGEFHPRIADVTKEAEVAGVVQFAMAEFGRIDILVNNAGSGAMAPFLDTSAEDWDRQMAVNARGPFLFAREAGRRMTERGQGRIVNISSMAGRRTGPQIAAYAASKFAAVGMTEVAGRELGRRGVRVYSLCPGAVATGMRREAAPDEDPSAIMQPSDIAALIAFLVVGGGSGLRDLALEVFR